MTTVCSYHWSSCVHPLFSDLGQHTLSSCAHNQICIKQTNDGKSCFFPGNLNHEPVHPTRPFQSNWQCKGKVWSKSRNKTHYEATPTKTPPLSCHTRPSQGEGRGWPYPLPHPRPGDHTPPSDKVTLAGEMGTLSRWPYPLPRPQI